MQHTSMQPSSSCPNCGAENRYRTWREISGGSQIYRGPLKVKTDAHAILGSMIWAFVCKQCGYVQLFVNPGDFKD
jgi:rubrerythrin